MGTLRLTGVSVLVLALTLAASGAAFVLLQEKAANDERVALKERAQQSTARFDTFARQIEGVMLAGGTVAAATEGDADAFRRAVERQLAASFLSSVVLLRLDESPERLVDLGSNAPMLFSELEPTAIEDLYRVSAAGELGLIASRSVDGARVLAFAASPFAGSRYVVYGELFLSDVLRPNDEANGLRYAFYVDGESPESLIASNSYELPLTGARVTERVRLGAERPLLVFTADGTLTSGLAAGLHWLVLGFGVVWSIMLTGLVEATRRGRDRALQLAGSLAGKNAALDESQQQLLRAQGRLAHAHEETIRRLARAAEARDNDTGAHIERVSAYAEILARKMGLPPTHCELIRLAAPLHDIGKIAVPDHILLKPGRHTPEERNIMRSHAETGRDVLAGSDAELLDLAATVAWTHHERFDGTGYPRGIAGEAIPIEGRILSIADAFDAMTSNRPYQQGRSVDEAAELLKEGRGTQFDPRLVDIFLAALADVREAKHGFGSDSRVDALAA